MSFEVRRVSNGPKHHLFGFHDLPITNARGDLALSLEVDDISHPPLPGESCAAGVIDLATGAFKKLHETHTWNYPQGARQQWIGDTDLCVCNDRAEDGTLISHIYNARTGAKVDTLPFPVHCVQAEKMLAIVQDYDRIHACGGYGYIGGRDSSRVKDIPEDEGLWIGDLRTKEKRLILTYPQIAACDEPKMIKTGYPHYVTHAQLNPSGTRIAFIDRYRVADGGDIDRLMTCDLDGKNLRCLCKGGMGHLMWIDDETVFGWGQHDPRLCAVRESRLLRIPGVFQAVMLAKRMIRVLRSLRTKKKPTAATASTPIQAHNIEVKDGAQSFLMLKDVLPVERRRAGVGIMQEDGHPMSCPAKPHLVVCDTYPNKDGDRWLMFYDIDKNERTNVGQFRRLFAEPDKSKFDWKASMIGLDPRVSKDFPLDGYLFWRSGYHTDLHPRWSYDGKTAFFDSIHEGTRQIYAVDYSC